MKKYKFLFKPLFFIFSLLFASWMVLAIEKIRPSDFGRYESLFQSGTNTFLQTSGKANFFQLNDLKKNRLKKICLDYKAGIIDSTTLNEQIEQILKFP